MKAKMKLCSTLLSIGIIASSFAPVFAAKNNDSFIPEISSFSDKESGFISGKLTEKSNKSPEKIVEENYNKDLSSDKNNKSTEKDKQFKKNKQFNNSEGRTVVQTTQTYNGVPVFGTEQNYHVNSDGVIECIIGSSVEDIDNKIAPFKSSIKTSQQDALNTVEKNLGFKPEYIEDPEFEMVLYPVNDEYVYSYKVSVDYNKPSYGSYIYYVDANSLSILYISTSMASAEQPTTGRGIGQFGEEIQNLEMVRDDNGTHYLESTIENFKTMPCGINPPRYSDTDNFFDGTAYDFQKDAVDAHENVQCVMKYFKNTFGRNGNDDNGSLYTVFIDESNPTYNALGDSNNVTFYVGHIYEYDLVNQIILRSDRSISCALDVVGHEYTHGILFSEGLQYDGVQEYGALHEGLADVFGTLCEKFITTDVVNNTTTFDWEFGEDGGFIPGYIKRDCANPVIDDYSEFIAGSTESHQGGGIISKAAYLIAEGGTHNGKTVAAIDADEETAYTKLADIFYEAINDGYMVPTMTFEQFAIAAVHVAGLAYPNSLEKETIIDAFIAVGVLNDVPTSFGISQRSGLTVEFSWLNDTYDTNYAIYRKVTGSADAPIKVKETTNSIDTAETLYGSCDFYVARVDYAGNRTSDFSNVFTVETAYLAAPTNFVTTSKTGIVVSFSWDGTLGNNYAIYRRVTGSTDTLEVVSSVITNTTGFAYAYDYDYDFYVAQVDSSGNRISDFSNVVTVESPHLAAPTNFVTTSRTGIVVFFSWDGTSGNNYIIYRRVTGSTDTLEVVSSVITNTTGFAYAYDYDYDFYVAQVDSSGNRISDFSNVVTIVT